MEASIQQRLVAATARRSARRSALADHLAARGEVLEPDEEVEDEEDAEIEEMELTLDTEYSAYGSGRRAPRHTTDLATLELPIS